jgi:hypothetical protein
MSKKTVLVRVDVTELQHMVNYEMYDEFVDLREHLSDYSNIGDLSQNEVDSVISACVEANNTQSYGVDVDIELGRHPSTDMRTYRLERAHATNCTSATIPLTEIKEYI